VAEFAPDRNKRVSARLDNGNVIRLTGVTTENLPRVIAAGDQELSGDEPGSVAVDDEVDQGDSGEKPA
jgi:hypothetical protein